MGRPSLKRPSCIVMIVIGVLLLAAIAWLASGYALRTPSPTSVPKESTTYDTDVPSGTGDRTP